MVKESRLLSCENHKQKYLDKKLEKKRRAQNSHTFSQPLAPPADVLINLDTGDEDLQACSSAPPPSKKKLQKITHYKTKSVHFWGLMNSTTKLNL